MLLNLLNNAGMFTPEGGTVEVSAAGDTTVAVIEVRDTGIGIASEDLEHVFEEFYQAAAGRAQGRAGTGLGLPLARHLAELQDGALTCTSTVGEGSTFRLTLPLEGPGCGRRKVRDCAADLSPDLDLGPAA